jgi:hypothetical protein
VADIHNSIPNTIPPLLLGIALRSTGNINAQECDDERDEQHRDVHGVWCGGEEKKKKEKKTKNQTAA